MLKSPHVTSQFSIRRNRARGSTKILGSFEIGLSQEACVQALPALRVTHCEAQNLFLSRMVLIGVDLGLEVVVSEPESFEGEIFPVLGDRVQISELFRIQASDSFWEELCRAVNRRRRYFGELMQSQGLQRGFLRRLLQPCYSRRESQTRSYSSFAGVCNHTLGITDDGWTEQEEGLREFNWSCSNSTRENIPQTSYS